MQVMTDQLTDLIAKDLTVLFCGINPGLTSATAGHHFSNRSNRFWRVLHQAGFTPHQILAAADHTILEYGYGLTTAVERPTVRADELSKEEFSQSLAAFTKKISTYTPRYLAFLGKPAYQAFFRKKEVVWGLQEERFCGAIVWVLPNPSGLNRSFTLQSLVDYYQLLRMHIQEHTTA